MTNAEKQEIIKVCKDNKCDAYASVSIGPHQIGNDRLGNPIVFPVRGWSVVFTKPGIPNMLVDLSEFPLGKTYIYKH